MAVIVKLRNTNGKTVYVNTDYITAFRYEIDTNITSVCFAGEKEYAMFSGDQTQKILDAMGGKDDG